MSSAVPPTAAGEAAPVPSPPSGAGADLATATRALAEIVEELSAENEMLRQTIREMRAL